eukprot:COSAG06_NODE_2872_length_6143_cov_2.234088_6_plen_150_part_00
MAAALLWVGDFLSLRRTLRGGSPDEMINALGRVELAVAVLVLNGNAGGGHVRGEEEEARSAPGWRGARVKRRRQLTKNEEEEERKEEKEEEVEGTLVVLSGESFIGRWAAGGGWERRRVGEARAYNDAVVPLAGRSFRRERGHVAQPAR